MIVFCPARLLSLAVVTACLLTAFLETSRAEQPLPQDAQTLIQFTGKIYPQRFLAVEGEPFGHHAITWKGGRASSKALIVADIPDKTVADTLAQAGVPAGNNLDSETWEARFDKKNPAADERVEGASLEIFVTWKGLDQPRSLPEILGMPETDYRFGDHRALIPIWKSGCIVCDVSCPGAKISNRTLTVRDQVMKRLRPHPDVGSLPPDGTEVEVAVYRGGSHVPANQP